MINENREEDRFSAFNRFNQSVNFWPKKLNVLYPSESHVTKNRNRQPFCKEIRANPFPVKDEHATRCQHIESTTSLKSALVSEQSIIANLFYL